MQPVPSCINAVFSRSSNKFTPRPFTGYQCVGYVKAAHGIRGELYVQLYARQADWLDSLEKIYLLAPAALELKCWTIERARPHKEGLIVLVEGVSDRNVSETMRKSGVYIEEQLLTAPAGETIFLKQILNFTVCDPQEVPLGTVVGFATNGAQDLLCVQTPEGGEVLIPFVEAFIVKIDFDKRSVKMDLPPGLIAAEAE